MSFDGSMRCYILIGRTFEGVTEIFKYIKLYLDVIISHMNLKNN